MAPHKEVVLRLSSMRYKQAGVSDEDFHDYCSKDHGPKAALIQARHGALKVVQYHTPTAIRDLIKEKMPWALRPGFEVADHDITINVWVRKIEDMLAIVLDPDFQGIVAGDDNIVDPSRGTLAVGWEEVYVEDGNIVNVVNGESAYASFAEKVKIGSDSRPDGEINEIAF